MNRLESIGGNISVWPRAIYEILAEYEGVQEKSSDKTLTPQQKEALVEELIAAYNRLPRESRRDLLIPAKPEFIADRAIKKIPLASGKNTHYSIRYNWPPDDGFAGKPEIVILSAGREYDRIGGSTGFYLSPISDDGVPASFLSRALPYYIPESNIEDSPAYHRYKVQQRYPEPDNGNDNVYQGIIAHAFWSDPDDGDGIQVLLPHTIKDLGAIFYEEKHPREQTVQGSVQKTGHKKRGG